MANDSLTDTEPKQELGNPDIQSVLRITNEIRRERVKRGYKPAARSESVRAVIADVNAFAELIPDLLTRIENCAQDRFVTRTELKRDLGYSESAIRFLEKQGHLRPVKNGRGRLHYSLSNALKLRVMEAGVFEGKPRIRTVRKHSRISTIQRDFWTRITKPRKCAA